MLGRLGGAMIGSGSETMRGAGSRTGAIRPSRPRPWVDPRREPAKLMASASRRLPPSRPFSGSRRSFPEADFFGGGATFRFEGGAAFLEGEGLFEAGTGRLAG